MVERLCIAKTLYYKCLLNVIVTLSDITYSQASGYPYVLPIQYFKQRHALKQQVNAYFVLFIIIKRRKGQYRVSVNEYIKNGKNICRNNLSLKCEMFLILTFSKKA